MRLRTSTLPLFLAAALGGCGDATTGTTDGPRIEFLTVTPEARVEPGGQLVVRFGMYDTSGVARSTVTLTGAVEREIETSEGGARTAERVVTVLVPPEARVGQSLTVRVTAHDAEGHSGSRTAPSVQVGDATPPRVTGGVIDRNGNVASTAAAAAKAVGDTLRIRVSATDNNRVGWVGYRLGAPANRRDSVAATGATAEYSGQVVVPAAWRGTSALTVFARDQAGNLTEVTPGADHVTVYSVRAVTETDVPLGAAVSDVTYDEARQRLYLLQSNERRVAVFSLTALAFETPIALPAAAGGIDLTPSGDSLLVTLPEQRALGIVDLRVPGRPVSQVPLVYDDDGTRRPERVRVAANDKAIVTVRGDKGSVGHRFLEYDLATRTQRVRTDVLPALDEYGTGSVLAASWDRTRVVAVSGIGCCMGQTLVYDATRDVLTAGGGRGHGFGPGTPLSVDAAGRGILLGGVHVNGDLQVARPVSPPEYGGFYYSPSAIAPDGSTGYFAVPTGYLSVRLSDGVVLERVDLARPGDSNPMTHLYRFLALPGGTRLVGWTWDYTKLVVISSR